ncbi:MAG: sensor histidine kinase [Acidimicrobiales bacterium]
MPVRNNAAFQRGFDAPVPLWRLMARYATTALVTLVVVAVLTAFASRSLGTDEAIEDAARVTTLAANAGIEPIITDAILTMEPDELARIDHVVRDSVIQGSLVRVKIWSADGTIVYSDEGRLIGEQFELDDESVELLAAGPSDVEAQAEVSDLDEPENKYEERAVKLLEVYLPIYTSTGTPLLFEAYFRYEGVAEAGRRAWLRFAPVTLGSLVFLSMLQGPLVFSIARRLRRTQDQREDLLQQAIQATDMERRRIASDLHDGVVQDLAGVTFALAATAREIDGDAKEQVTTASSQVRDAIRSLRSLLVEIYPPNLEEEGLEASLSDLMARLDPRGIGTRLSIEANVENIDLDTKQLVYRTAQEGLRNVIVHSQASQVDVTLTDTGPCVVLTVFDDGIGFDPIESPPREGHLGLRALDGLVRSSGARLTVSSVPGKGTELRLEVPKQ